MEMIQIAAVGVIGAILSITIKKQNPEFALLLGIVTGVIIFLFLADKIGQVVELLQMLSSSAGVNTEYLSIVLKVIGIAYIAEFGTELCADAGEHSIAAKIQLAGKILILVVASPVLLTLMQMVLEMAA